jgi:hypothetical protein
MISLIIYTLVATILKNSIVYFIFFIFTKKRATVFVNNIKHKKLQPVKSICYFHAIYFFRHIFINRINGDYIVNISNMMPLT